MRPMMLVWVDRHKKRVTSFVQILRAIFVVSWTSPDLLGNALLNFL